jgi:hypothetical protein
VADDQHSGLLWRVSALEGQVKRQTIKQDEHAAVLSDHATRLQARESNEAHIVSAIHEVKTEIRSFRNYALATMVMFIVGLLTTLFMLLMGSGVDIVPP